jgi:hypothetical protein
VEFEVEGKRGEGESGSRSMEGLRAGGVTGGEEEEAWWWW